MIDNEENPADSKITCSDAASDSPPVKFPRLLFRYKALKKRSMTQNVSAITQMNKYLDEINLADCDSALSFWAKNRERFPQLYKLALRVLSVPASSAPVERVFSRGGLIMRPHRARLGHKMLESLIFLKCNQDVL